MHSSVREIRTRLLTLLMIAFISVWVLSIVFFLTVFSYFLTQPTTGFPNPFTGVLEGYYVGHNSWEGVDKVIGTNDELSSLKIILLDENQRIMLDRRLGSPADTFGLTYTLQPSDIALPLTVNEKSVGTLVITTLSIESRLSLIRGVAFPALVISVVLGISLLVVATLLVRRFVNPLADVIFAARSVADGNLSTRIQTQGTQDLRVLSESFNEMASSLERNDRERRDMLADIAHELRTPLSVIRGRLEGIIDGIYSENGSQVSLALQQTYILERLVDDLRLLTLAETRQLAFDKSNVDLGHLIERVLNIFSAEAQEKNISLAFTEKSGELSVYLDQQRIEQVISNLISNAIRYIPEGSKVWVTAKQISESVEITINDNGAGISADDLPFIFERFWRKDKSRSRTTGGTGLGLAIANQLVKAQGGTIEARNLPEGGLQVIINLKK